MADDPDHAGCCERGVCRGQHRRLADAIRQPACRKRDGRADRVVREVEADRRRQRRRVAQLGLHHLRRSQREESRGEVAGAEHRHRDHQAPEPCGQRHPQRHRLRAFVAGIAGQDGEQHDASHARDERDPEHRSKAASGRKQDERRRRADERARRVERLVEAEGFAQVAPADGAGQHRGADRLAQPASHPGDRPRDDDLGPEGDRDEQAQAEDGRAVAADRQPLSPRDAIAVPAAPELDHGRRSVGDPLDQADSEGRRPEAGGDEQGQDGEHHLVVRVGGEVGDADSEDVAVEPPHARLGAQTTSTASGRNGPPSFSAMKAFASTASPFATDTMRYT